MEANDATLFALSGRLSLRYAAGGDGVSCRILEPVGEHDAERWAVDGVLVALLPALSGCTRLGRQRYYRAVGRCGGRLWSGSGCLWQGAAPGARDYHRQPG